MTGPLITKLRKCEGYGLTADDVEDIERLISKAWLLPEVIDTLKFVADKCGNPDLECYIDNLLAKLTEKGESL